MGEYRGPESASAFLRYAREKHTAERRREVYRDFVTEHLRALVGSNLHYRELTSKSTRKDFDAGKVVDDVIAKMGLEVSE